MGTLQGKTIADKLLEMKKEIEAAQQRVSALNGRLSVLTEQMEKEFGVKTVDEAKEKLSVMDADIAQMEEDLQKEVSRLEIAYDWGRA